MTDFHKVVCYFRESELGFELDVVIGEWALIFPLGELPPARAYYVIDESCEYRAVALDVNILDTIEHSGAPIGVGIRIDRTHCLIEFFPKPKVTESTLEELVMLDHE